MSTFKLPVSKYVNVDFALPSPSSRSSRSSAPVGFWELRSPNRPKSLAFQSFSKCSKLLRSNWASSSPTSNPPAVDHLSDIKFCKLWAAPGPKIGNLAADFSGNHRLFSRAEQSWGLCDRLWIVMTSLQNVAAFRTHPALKCSTQEFG